MAHVPANHDPGGPQSGSLADALYKELWSACAGPLVNVFHEGERAFHRGTWNRTCHSPFVISLNKYLQSQSYKLAAGLKCKQVLEKRVSGTILSVGNPEASKYKASEWRSIKVTRRLYYIKSRKHGGWSILFGSKGVKTRIEQPESYKR